MIRKVISPIVFCALISGACLAYTFESVSVEKIRSKLIKPDSYFAIIDVREKADFDQNHLPEAVNVPFSSLTEEATKVPIDRDLYFICYGGNRSKKAIRVFQDFGFPNKMFNIDGGMLSWESNIGMDFVTAQELKKAKDAGEFIIVFDMNNPKDYEAAHIPGSVNLSLLATVNKVIVDNISLDKNTKIVAYCGRGCGVAFYGARNLKRFGFKNIYALPDGLDAWIDNGYPIQVS